MELDRWKKDKTLVERLKDGITKNDWSDKKIDEEKKAREIKIAKKVGVGGATLIGTVLLVAETLLTEAKERITREETLYQADRGRKK